MSISISPCSSTTDVTQICLRSKSVEQAVAVGVRGAVSHLSSKTFSSVPLPEAASGFGVNVFQLDATAPLGYVLASQLVMPSQDVVDILPDSAERQNAVTAGLTSSILAVHGRQVAGSGA